MKITIDIDTDSDHMSQLETHEQLAYVLSFMLAKAGRDTYAETIIDGNGNTIGSATIEPGETVECRHCGETMHHDDAETHYANEHDHGETGRKLPANGNARHFGSDRGLA